MDNTTNDDLAVLIKALRGEVAELTGRVAALELRGEAAGNAVADDGATRTASPSTDPAAVAAVPAPAAQPEASEEDMVVIGAAVAAFVGVRARIRQVRLIQSSAWAQVGRATVHASHRMH